MKRYISVFEMITRSSIYKVVLILLLMTGAEIGLFLHSMEKHVLDDEYYALEMIVEYSNMVWALLIAFLLITAVITLTGCNIGSNQNYTLRRLRISENKVFFLQVLYNILCYVLLWATQWAVLWGCSLIYMEKAVDVNNQTMFLAFYRNDLMHSILPLEDVWGWILLICIICGCSIAAAGFAQQQRNGKIGWELFLILAVTIITFPRALGESYAILFVCMFIFPVQWIYRKVLGKGDLGDEEEIGK